MQDHYSFHPLEPQKKETSITIDIDSQPKEQRCTITVSPSVAPVTVVIITKEEREQSC